MCLFRSCLLVDWKEFSFRVKTIYRIIIGKHFFTFFSSEIFARLDLQTLSIVFFLSHRIAFRLYALRTSQPSSSTKKTQDDGWQSDRERFVRLSQSRKCGDANNRRIVKVSLKAKRRF